MPEQMSGPSKAGVVNPYAMVEVLHLNNNLLAAGAVSLTGKNYNSFATISAAAPTPIDYDTSGIVADHCYSILGWQFVNPGRRYFPTVLRLVWLGELGPVSRSAASA